MSRFGRKIGKVTYDILRGANATVSGGVESAKKVEKTAQEEIISVQFLIELGHFQQKLILFLGIFQQQKLTFFEQAQ